MNTLLLSRFLGWFSLGLGAVEAVAPHGLARSLGMFGEAWLVRAFGFREIAAGVTVLAKPDQPVGPMLRVAGDVLDLAVLAPALSSRNKRSDAAHIAFVMVLGVTALDILCASALVANEQRRAATSQRARQRRPAPVARPRARPAKSASPQGKSRKGRTQTA